GLREKDLTPALGQFLQFIVDLSDRAANLTKQLLAFARKPALSRQPTYVEQLLRSTADLVRHTLALDVNLEIAPDPEPLVAMADTNQLQQVLVNLSLNARDAMSQPATIVFRLRHATLSGDMPCFPEKVPVGDYVVLEVQDQGTGMSPEVLVQ